MLNLIVMAQSLGTKQKTLRKTVFMGATDLSRFSCIKVCFSLTLEIAARLKVTQNPVRLDKFMASVSKTGLSPTEARKSLTFL